MLLLLLNGHDYLPRAGAYVFHDPGCIVLDLGVDARVMGKGTAHAKTRVPRQDVISKETNTWVINIPPSSLEVNVPTYL